MNDEENENPQEWDTRGVHLREALRRIRRDFRNLEWAVEMYGEVEDATVDKHFSPQGHFHRKRVAQDLWDAMMAMLAFGDDLRRDMGDWHPLWFGILELEFLKPHIDEDEDYLTQVAAPELWECPGCGECHEEEEEDSTNRTTH